MNKKDTNEKKYILKNGESLVFSHEGVIYFQTSLEVFVLFKNVLQIYFVKSNTMYGIVSFLDKDFKHHFLIFELATKKIVCHLKNTRVKIAHLHDIYCFVGVNHISVDKKIKLEIIKIDILSNKQDILYTHTALNSLRLISMSQPHDSKILFSFSSAFLTTTILLDNSIEKQIDQYSIDSKRYLFKEGEIVCVACKNTSLSLFRVGVSFDICADITQDSYIKNCIFLDRYVCVHIGNIWNDRLCIFDQETKTLVVDTMSQKGAYFENVESTSDGFYFSERHLFFFKKYHIGLDKKIRCINSKILLDDSVYNFSIEEDLSVLPDFSLIQNKSSNNNLLVCVYGNHRVNDAMLTYSSFIRDWVEKGGVAVYIKTEGDTTLQKESYRKSIDQISTAIDYFSNKGFKITLLGVSTGGTTVLDFVSTQKNSNITQAYSLIPHLSSWFYDAVSNRIVVPEHIPLSLELNTGNINCPLVIVSAEYDDRCLLSDASLMKHGVEQKNNFIVFQTVDDSNHLNFIRYYNKIT